MTASPTMTAMVVNRMHGQPTVQLFPMTSVSLAREEFGPTLTDAKLFVLDTCCTECGMSNEDAHQEGRECHGCGERGCDCLVADDGHGDAGTVFFCNRCRPVCGGYCCTD